MSFKTCPCGSNQERFANQDARGIFLCFTCDKCHEAKMSHYRPDVLSDSQYWADELIEEDY